MGEVPGRNQIFVKRLTDIILSNLRNENFGVKELVHESGLSRYSLTRRLYAITNKTINQFIRETRLRKALEMLQNEDLTVAEAAYKTGFGSATYFNTCFNEFFGFSPGAVRKEDLKNNLKTSVDQVTLKPKNKRFTLPAHVLFSSGILFFVILFYLVYYFLPKNSLSNADSHIRNSEKSVAVLPFKNLSDSTNNQYFIDGVMEDILTNLSRIHDLRVISRTSVEQYRESDESASEIAKKLKVNYIVEGSGQKVGNDFRLRVQLIDAIKDKHIWAESYEQEIQSAKEIFSIQKHVAQSIAAELKATITPEEKLSIEKIPTLNLIAYDFWQRGINEVKKFDYPEYNAKANKKAESFFRKALEYDSTFANAYIGLGWIYVQRTERDPAILDNDLFVIYLDSMLRVADKALYYDHESISGYYLRGIYYKSLGDTKQAKEEFEKAIRIDPNVSQLYRLLGYCQDNMIKSLECMGKEALLDHSIGRANSLRNLGDQYFAAGFPKLGNAFYLDALKLDGDTALYSADLVRVSAWCYGEYKKALEYYQKSYLKDTTDASTILCLGYYNATAGRYKESLKFYNKYLAGKESYENCKLSRTQRKLMEYLLIYVYIQNGDRREADHLADKVIDINNSYIRSYPYLVDHYTLACIYASRGENAKAYENLRICNQNGIYYLSRVIILRNDPFFSNIRNEPEFQKIVKNLEAKYQAEHERVRKWLEEKENSGYIIR